MSHSQFHCTGRVYLHVHGLIFETSICYWQDQPGSLDARSGPRPGTWVLRGGRRALGGGRPPPPRGAGGRAGRGDVRVSGRGDGGRRTPAWSLPSRAVAAGVSRGGPREGTVRGSGAAGGTLRSAAGAGGRGVRAVGTPG